MSYQVVIMKKRILHLPVKKIYFDQIKSGEKPDEYRLVTDYWIKRLEGREYDEVHVKCGYPKA
ncbi:ASCH domain-containing protein, partial [Salmonella enterica]|nr:ASCH domain-containing protein [Salmonella enterica]